MVTYCTLHTGVHVCVHVVIVEVHVAVVTIVPNDRVGFQSNMLPHTALSYILLCKEVCVSSLYVKVLRVLCMHEQALQSILTC